MLCLTKDELIELTHRKKYSAQKSALNMMGIDYKVRPDGTVAVIKDLAFAVNSVKVKKRIEPNFGAAR